MSNVHMDLNTELKQSFWLQMKSAETYYIPHLQHYMNIFVYYIF